MCLFGLLYNHGLRFTPIHQEDHSISWVLLLLFINIIVLILWLLILPYFLILIPKRLIWSIRALEREKILTELAETKPHQRQEKLIDMCFVGLGWGAFGTDEFMLYLDSKFKLMEDAGMFSDNGSVLHTSSWGYLEGDPFIGRMLASARKREKCKPIVLALLAEEFWEMLGMTPGLHVALEGYPRRLRRKLEAWKETKAAAQDEKEGWILVDVVEK